MIPRAATGGPSHFRNQTRPAIARAFLFGGQTLKLISYQELANAKGIRLSKRQLARLEAAGRWPRRVRVSRTSWGWPENEIDGLLTALAAQRGEAACEE
jgi:prophage regulatory protein